MADPLKSFIRHMDGINRGALADAAAKMMAEHCDKRIKNLRKAVLREERHLIKVMLAGTVMLSDIEGAFLRLQAALDKPVKM